MQKKYYKITYKYRQKNSSITGTSSELIYAFNRAEARDDFFEIVKAKNIIDYKIKCA